MKTRRKRVENGAKMRERRNNVESEESMEENKQIARHSFCLGMCVLLVALCLTGCGYAVRGRSDLPFQSVGIGKIINKTFEPKLEDRMQRALVDELMTNGFTIDNSAAYKISGDITTFSLSTLSEKGGVAIEYEVIIKGDFRLVDPSGKSRKLRNHGVFIVSFPSADALQSVIAQKELATERALRDLCSEIVASIMYSGLAGK
jgi:hypothetical protein